MTLCALQRGYELILSLEWQLVHSGPFSSIIVSIGVARHDCDGSMHCPMKPKIAAFPKCYIDQIAGDRTMSVFDWIKMAKTLDADGLEMYEGFFTSLDDGYIDSVGDAIRAAGFEMPMLCCSPDFTQP